VTPPTDDRVPPLLAAFGCCLALLLPAVDDGADLVVTRVALSLFGDYVGEDGPRRQRQRDLMRAAHVAGTHRTYAAKTPCTRASSASPAASSACTPRPGSSRCST